MGKVINMVAIIIIMVLVIGIGLTLAEYCKPDPLWFYRDILGFDIGSGCR